MSDVFLAIKLDATSSVPLRQQLYRSITEAMEAGRLPAGTRLPSSRFLAKQLDLSRSTVVDVFDQLIAEGLTSGRVGCGTFVNSSELSGRNARPKSGAVIFSPSVKTARALDVAARTPRAPLPIGAFRVGVPALNLFPMDLWTRSVVRAGQSSAHDLLDYGDNQGYVPLRRTLADRLALLRGVRCDHNQLFIVEGAHRAIAYAAQVLIDAGDSVLVEDPCSARLRGALVACGAAIAAVRVDASGMMVPPIGDNAIRPKMLCVTPSHQFPTGVTMTLERRLELLAWARSSNAWIVEDDYEHELRYEGAAVDTLHSLDTDGRVIYIGSFSSTMFPGLRIGYVVVPDSLVDAFSATLRVSSCGPSSLEQAALTHFIETGAYTRHLNRMRSLYAERRAALVAGAERDMSGLLELASTNVGTFAAAAVVTKAGDRSVSALAAQRGLNVRPISLLTANGVVNGLVLGYAAASVAQIKRGCAELSHCLKLASNAPTAVSRS